MSKLLEKSKVKVANSICTDLTTQEKRVVLITAHEEKMNDLAQWCDKMLNKLK